MLYSPAIHQRNGRSGKRPACPKRGDKRAACPHGRAAERRKGARPMQAVLELVGVSKSFPGVAALRDVVLTLRAGSVHALVGENGAGKSTLIHILSGVLAPDGGEVRLDGQPLRLADARAAHARGIVTVPQEVDLFPDLTVAE